MSFIYRFHYSSYLYVVSKCPLHTGSTMAAICMWSPSVLCIQVPLWQLSVCGLQVSFAYRFHYGSYLYVVSKCPLHTGSTMAAICMWSPSVLCIQVPLWQLSVCGLQVSFAYRFHYGSYLFVVYKCPLCQGSTVAAVWVHCSNCFEGVHYIQGPLQQLSV